MTVVVVMASVCWQVCGSRLAAVVLGGVAFTKSLGKVQAEKEIRVRQALLDSMGAGPS